LSLPRRILDAALVDEARRSGVTVMEGTKLVALLRGMDRGESGAGRGAPVGGALVESAGRALAIRSKVLVGADGLQSMTARLIGHRRHGAPRRYAFVAHVAGVRDVGQTAEMHVGRQGYVGINAIGDGLVNVAVVVPAERAIRARGDAAGFWFRTLESFPALRGRVRRAGIVRDVLVSGPFAAWSRRVISDGALLVGDAADFFDPFTGEGICAGLRGAELAAATLVEALRRPGPVTAASLAPYAIARRRAFLGKWMVERMIGWGMLAPALFDRALGRLERRGLAHTLVGVTGDFVPAREVLRPGFLAAMMV
jgi:flavin-dependent dehydrogenase